MEIKDAKYILCIYKNNSISKASRELYISQPSLSKYLQNLEQRLGAPLFDRSNNRYILTHLGKRYLKYAEELTKINDEWERECKSIVDNVSGKLIVALPLTRSFCLIPDILLKFNLKYPHVSIELIEENYNLSEDFVLNEDIDFAIFNIKENPQSIEYEKLFKEEIVLVCSKESSISKFSKKNKDSEIRYINITDIKNERVIMLSTIQNTGKFVKNLFAEKGVNPNIVLTTRSHHTAVDLVSQNIGICFAPVSYIKKLSKYHEINFYSVYEKEEKLKSDLILAYKKNKYLTDYAKYFIELTKEAFSKL